MNFASSEDSIYISGITVGVRQGSHKTVDHVVLRTQFGGFKTEIPGKLSPGQEHKEAFEDPLELSWWDELSVSMQYRSRWLGIEHTPHITLNHSEIMKELQKDIQRKETYTKHSKYIFVTLDITSKWGTIQEPLSPTTSEILRICPRFRLLIIGNTDLEKSSLIRDAFGVADVFVSEGSRGQAGIDREFDSPRNDFFAIHDSLGLEIAEGKILTRVKNFIHERRRKQDLKDRLHAVWVCLPVPYPKGRLLDARTEEFLRDRKKILGNILVVVVLTKFDLLDDDLIDDLYVEGARFRTIEEVQPLLEPRRAKYVQEYCTEPLLQAVGDIPHVAVSTESGYHLEPTISQLVRKTASEIERCMLADLPHGVVSEQQTIERNAPLYIAGMTQRASIERKVDVCIEIGKIRHWANLGASLRFRTETVRFHLVVMHHDMTQVWNLDDPEMVLQSDGFKQVLLDAPSLVSGGDVGPAGSIASALAPLIVDPTTVVATFPIAGTITLAELCTEIYILPQTIAKRLMAYITDLIYVMRILFILALHRPVTVRDAALAVDVYTRSMYRNRIHLEVNEFYATGAMPGGEAIVDKIEVLIRRYNITDKEVLYIQSQIHALSVASQNAPSGGS